MDMHGMRIGEAVPFARQRRDLPPKSTAVANSSDTNTSSAGLVYAFIAGLIVLLFGGLCCWCMRRRLASKRKLRKSQEQALTPGVAAGYDQTTAGWR
jgi:hypothetical protein